MLEAAACAAYAGNVTAKKDYTPEDSESDSESDSDSEEAGRLRFSKVRARKGRGGEVDGWGRSDGGAVWRAVARGAAPVA